MTRRLSCFLLLALSAGLAGCDHVTKLAASRHLAGSGPVEIVPGVLDLRYAENRNLAFSLLSDWGADHKTLVLGMVALLVLGAMSALWWRRRRAPVLEQAGYAIVIGGALGNVIDRLFRGYVIDFVHLKHWPIFNVADVAVVAGALLLAWRVKDRAMPEPS